MKGTNIYWCNESNTDYHGNYCHGDRCI